MKHVLKNTISLILAAIFLVLLLAACGGTSSASTGSALGRVVSRSCIHINTGTGSYAGIYLVGQSGTR